MNKVSNLNIKDLPDLQPWDLVFIIGMQELAIWKEYTVTLGEKKKNLEGMRLSDGKVIKFQAEQIHYVIRRRKSYAIYIEETGEIQSPYYFISNPSVDFPDPECYVTIKAANKDMALSLLKEAFPDLSGKFYEPKCYSQLEWDTSIQTHTVCHRQKI